MLGEKPTAAVNGTGLDCCHTFRHYACRHQPKRFRLRRYVLLTVACHTESHLLVVMRVGPTTEPRLFPDLIYEANRHARWDRMLAYSAHDAEHNHRLRRGTGRSART